MDAWQEVNVLLRRIDAGELDKFLQGIGVACSRRFMVVAGKSAAPGFGSSNPKQMDEARALTAMKAQQKHRWLPGDLGRATDWAPWKLRGIVFKVMRVNERSLFVRPLGQDNSRLTVYQRLVGFKVEIGRVLPILEPSEAQVELAAAIALPGPKLNIKKKEASNG